MENNIKIEFEESDNGTPIIKLGEYGKLMFSKLTAHPFKGYKYLCYVNKYLDTITVKGKERSKSYSIPTNDSYMVNMKLERNSRLKKGLPYGTIPQRLKDFLKISLKKYTEGGYIAHHLVDELKADINGQVIENILDEVQKPRKKRRKKSK